MTASAVTVSANMIRLRRGRNGDAEVPGRNLNDVAAGPRLDSDSSPVSKALSRGDDWAGRLFGACVSEPFAEFRALAKIGA
jgi:hypothetical protein